jgi:hypothetical protein
MGCTECHARNGHLLGCSLTDPSFMAGASTLAEQTRQDERAEVEANPYERFRLVAFPLAFVFMWVFSATGFGQGLLRIFFGMWLHELGHASAAWVTGRWALPLPWMTYSFDKSLAVSFIVFSGAAALLWFGKQRGSPTTIALGVLLVLGSVVGHLAPASMQQPFFIFGGEAGAMVYGVLVACGFLVRSPLKLFQGGLRWGWLVIGSASWSDAMRVWWNSRADPDAIPFGLEDGMPSDATRLVDEFGWDQDVMVHRFLLVGVVTLAVALLAFVAAAVREALSPRSLA